MSETNTVEQNALASIFSMFGGSQEEQSSSIEKINANIKETSMPLLILPMIITQETLPL